jgi:two-component system, NarL family, nitrate/nitrite response regulator NarL
MPGMSGIEAIRHIRAQVPHSKIVMLSLHESRQLAEMVFVSGANGYVMKPQADLDIPNALAAVTRGETYISPGIFKRAAQA